MKGLELSESYFNEFGMPMLKSKFGDLMPYLAAGLVGSGSECFGYDDEASTDHDFEPRFCIFVPDDDNLISRADLFKLEREYARLPDEFCGFKRQKVNPAGGNRHGVIKIGDFYRSKTGFADGRLTLDAWLRTPEFYLAEAVNGRVFFDNFGVFSQIRASLASMPRDAVLKRLAGNLAYAAQSGKYNYLRSVSRGENGAAQLTLFEFEKAASNAFFLLSGKYQPYFKWKYRAMRDLPDGENTCEKLTYLITHPNGYEYIDNKLECIESITDILCRKTAVVFPDAKESDLERAAFAINNLISDARLRNENIFCCV